MLDKLQNKALQYLTAFEELAKQYTSDVIDTTLKIVQLHGIQQIMYGTIGLLIVLIICVVGYIFIRQGAKERNGDKIVATVFIGFIPIFIGIILSTKLLDIWNWIAIFEPKLYIGYKIFEKILN